MVLQQFDSHGVIFFRLTIFFFYTISGVCQMNLTLLQYQRSLLFLDYHIHECSSNFINLFFFSDLQTCRPAEGIGASSAKITSYVGVRMAINWRTTVQRMGSLYDPYTRAAHSAISASTEQNRIDRLTLSLYPSFSLTLSIYKR